MLMSMTAFGRSEHEVNGRRVLVEIRSFNHRYCDILVRLPKKYVALEEKAKSLISKYVTRGRVEVSVQMNEGHTADRLELDIELAKTYFALLTRLKEELNIPGDITLESMMGFKEIVSLKEEGEDMDYAWRILQPPLEQALHAMKQMRIEEGNTLREDFLIRLDAITSALDEIKDRSHSLIPAHRDRLHQRIKSYIGGLEVDQNRLMQEVAYFVERSDVTEEIVRCKSHINQFRDMLDYGEPVGRKLNFLLQELNREVNTIGARAEDASISHKVVDIKAELERLREQVQNIE